MASDDGGSIERIRTWMNTGPGRLVTIVLAVGVIGAAVGWAVMRATGGDASEGIREKGRKALWYCTSCKQSGEVRVSYDAAWPMDCPKCGKHTAVLAQKCRGRNCGKIIPAPGPGQFVRCPYCGKMYDMRQIPTGMPTPPRR